MGSAKRSLVGRGMVLALALLVLVALTLQGCARPQVKRLSIVTGGTGGVYYVYGGGLAALISKYVKGVEATAEVTAASVDNCKLIQAGKAELAFVMADTANDAFLGQAKFKETGKVPLRALATLYSNFTHIVVLDGSGIRSVGDLRGKRVSTGAPGSGTEVIAVRVLEAYGIDPDKDIVRDRLGVSESAGALKDRKIDAFFWSGGLPTAAVLDLAATPGVRIVLLPHDDAVKKMVDKYGPVYFTLTIPKGTYPNVDVDVPVSAVGNLLVTSEKMEEDLAYRIVRAMFEHQADLVLVHKEAKNLTLQTAVMGSPIPYHPGAIKYYKEKQVWKGQ